LFQNAPRLDDWTIKPLRSDPTPLTSAAGVAFSNSGVDFQTPPRDPFARVSGMTRFDEADLLKKRGKGIREAFNDQRNVSFVPSFDANGVEGLAYRKQWSDREQCPPSLKDFVDYQKREGFSPGFTKEALTDLFGEARDLDGIDSRDLYHRIIETNRYIYNQNPFRLSLLDAEAASSLRAQAREYVRERTNDASNRDLVEQLPWYERWVVNTIGLENALKVRDFFKYGTSETDPDFWLGKYGSEDEVVTSQAIFNAALRASPDVDELAKRAKVLRDLRAKKQALKASEPLTPPVLNPILPQSSPTPIWSPTRGADAKPNPVPTIPKKTSPQTTRGVPSNGDDVSLILGRVPK